MKKVKQKKSIAPQIIQNLIVEFQKDFSELEKEFLRARNKLRKKIDTARIAKISQSLKSK